MLQVAELWRYPLKSVGGEPVDTLAIEKGAAGWLVAGDRALGIFRRGTSQLLSAKRYPALLEMVAHSADGAIMVRRGAQVWPAPSEELAQALSASVGFAVEVRAADATEISEIGLERVALDGAAPSLGAFAGPAGRLTDTSHALHAVASGTLAALQAAHGLGAGDVRRYRPNVVLTAPAGDEAQWVGRVLGVGPFRARVVEATERCVMPSRAQPGLPHDPTLLRYLHQHHGFCVGVYLEPLVGGVLRRGEPCVLAPYETNASS